jgi:ubiquinone/menaquinone biosynthesis C-methylase UbiE
MSEQNIYDNDIFFNGYKSLRENEKGFNTAIEQPVLRSLLPSLQNKVICDLGCGFGDFCRYAVAEDAKQMIGVDISKKMLDEAKRQTTSEKIIYVNEAIEKFVCKKNSFDIIVSSLAFHYVADIEVVFKKIHVWLNKKGIFVFTVEHPICTANPSSEMLSLNNEIVWPLTNYRDEGAFKQSWFVDNVIKYHRKTATYINALLEAGFSLEKIVEPMANQQLVVMNQQFKIHSLRPPLLAFRVKV